MGGGRVVQDEPLVSGLGSAVLPVIRVAASGHSQL